MRTQTFVATAGGKDKQVKVRALGNGAYEVEIDGKRHQVDARRFVGGNWNLLIDAQSYDIELEVATRTESEGAYNALVRGRVVQMQVQDERHVRMGISSKKFTYEGPQTLLSPMPGKVVKLLVEVGAQVTDGQPLILIEAMKMENELRSPKTGRVSAVYVTPGQAVEARTKLVVVE